MYNKIWEEGEIPNIWKHAKITPLMKEGKDPKDVGSYRPVALGNIFCKTFEKIKYKKRVWYLEKEKKIDDKQLGFRKQRSSIDAISKIFDKFRRKEKTAVIFFDIEKAYDKVNRGKTPNQLENMGIQ